MALIFWLLFTLLSVVLYITSPLEGMFEEDEISNQAASATMIPKVWMVAIDKFDKFEITALSTIEWHRDKEAKQS